MEKFKKKKTEAAQYLLILAFAAMAMACSGSKEEMDDIRTGAKAGWEIGKKLGEAYGSDAGDIIPEATPEDDNLILLQNPAEENELANNQ